MCRAGRVRALVRSWPSAKHAQCERCMPWQFLQMIRAFIASHPYLIGPHTTPRRQVTCTVDDGTPVTKAGGEAFSARFGMGAHTVVCTAADAAGNVSPVPAAFQYVVKDTTAPEITCNSNVEPLVPFNDGDAYDLAWAFDGASGSLKTTLGAGEAAFSVAEAFKASAADINRVAVACSPAGATAGAAVGAPVGLTCVATDAYSNSAECSFDFTLKDNKAPDLSVPSAQTVEANGPNGYAIPADWPYQPPSFGAKYYDPPTMDDWSAAACTAPRAPGAPVACAGRPCTLPLGATTVTCNAADKVRGALLRPPLPAPPAARARGGPAPRRLGWPGWHAAFQQLSSAHYTQPPPAPCG